MSEEAEDYCPDCGDPYCYGECVDEFEDFLDGEDIDDEFEDDLDDEEFEEFDDTCCIFCDDPDCDEECLDDELEDIEDF